jgi:hypothetical protein
VLWDTGLKRFTGTRRTRFPEADLPDPGIGYAIPTMVIPTTREVCQKHSADRRPTDHPPPVDHAPPQHSSDDSSGSNDDDDDLLPLPDMWTADQIATPIFSCGGTPTPDPAALKGSALTKIVLDDSRTPAMAKVGPDEDNETRIPQDSQGPRGTTAGSSACAPREHH